MKTIMVMLLLLAANGEPPSSCQVTPVFDQTTQAWVNLYSNCGAPSEHSPGDSASPS